MLVKKKLEKKEKTDNYTMGSSVSDSRVTAVDIGVQLWEKYRNA